MKWRDMLIGSIATLLVTIISGLVIYYLTKEPHVEPKENLVYLVDNSASFQFASNDFAVVSIVFVNQGTRSANNIIGNIIFPSGYIKDRKITSSSGADNEIKELGRSLNSYSFTLARFLPNDKITLIFLLDAKTSDPSINIRSDSSIASKGTYNQLANSPMEKWYQKVIGAVVVPALFGLTITLIVLFLKLKLGQLPRGNSLNDAAFVLMHKGLTKRAEIMLRRAVFGGKDGSHAIANYALSRALLGFEDESVQLLEAAFFLAKTKHEKAVVHFNQSLVAMKFDKWADAVKLLAEAVQLSRSEVKFYCENSTIFLNFSKNRPEIMAILSKNKEAP